MLRRSLHAPQVVAPNAPTEREMLTALFRAAGGENWYRKDNWDTDAELSTWHGVKVNNQDRVVGLFLAENNLQGIHGPSPRGQFVLLCALQLPSRDSSCSAPS